MTAATKERRVERYLARGEAEATEAADAEQIVLKGAGRAPIGAPRAVVAALVKEGRIVRTGTRLSLARAAADLTARATVVAERRETPFGTDEVMVNPTESPLAFLNRIRTRAGDSFLGPAEFRAGERLRVDFTRGQIMPRLGANWEAAVSSARRGNGTADISDAALAARLRVNRAITAVGPELGGLLLDVCCFLKGLEQVEMERDLPRRSAKVLLKTALSMLARHYEPAGSRRRATLHWGSSDYRPTMSGP